MERARSKKPGMALLASRTVRFHRELFVGTSVEVRSVRLDAGEHAGAIVHLLSGSGRLSATALDLPGTGGQALPGVGVDAVRLALPRAAPGAGRDPDAPEAEVAETGAVRPSEIDHTGALLYEEILRRAAFGLHGLLDRLGFTPEFTSETGVGRMAVESRVEPLGACRPGDHVRVTSRIAAVERKSFSTQHRLQTDAGETVARIEHGIVAVDLKARRAVDLPDFLRDAIAG
jgi:acyl-CoA thioester hydrolase